MSENGKRLAAENTGRKHTTETKMKISKANTGKKRSPETREKQRQAKLGKSWGKHSSKTKRKMSEQKLGEKNPMHGKCGKEHHNAVRVSQEDLKGNLIAIFDSLLEAQEKTGISFKTISFCVNLKTKTSGGFVWKRL